MTSRASSPAGAWRNQLPEVDVLALANRALGLALHLPPSLLLERDIEFGRTGRPLTLHLVRPKRARGLLPAVVYIFAGGWQAGSPDQGMLPVALMARRGYLGVSIDYRLSHEATFPSQLEDCKCAVRFLRANAKELGIDPDRIGAIGPSAGGHLAALLGVTAGMPDLEGDGGWAGERSDVQAVLDWFGPTDLLAIGYEHGNANSPETMTARLIGGPLIQNRDKADRANPISYIETGKSYPPFLIMHGTSDRLVPPSQSELLHKALRQVGAESELLMVPDHGHGWLGVKAVRRSASFLDKHLWPRKS